LNEIPTAPNTLRSDPPHAGQISSGSSVKDWTTSSGSPQSRQRYS
jgi:hypothetical protein